MKIRIIRERKKKILKEAAMGPDDLPKDYFIFASVKTGGSMRIQYMKKRPWETDSENPGKKISGSIIVAKAENCPKNVFEVMSIQATDGWGPLLYDVAMELVYVFSEGVLKADAKLVSAEAKGVWDFYDKRRTDVKPQQLDIHDKTIENIYGVYGNNKYPPPKKITPNDPSDDCDLSSAIKWAGGKGDWKNYTTKEAMDAIFKNPEKVEKWREQSISRAFKKDDIPVIKKLAKNLQIIINEKRDEN